MRKLLLIVGCILISHLIKAQSRVEQITTKEDELVDGYLIKKIPLEFYASPDIKISQVKYGDSKRNLTTTSSALEQEVKVILGKEQKQPFALLYIPAYNVKGQLLLTFTITIHENTSSENKIVGHKTTGASSVLASGDWYKIAIKERGVYKIDYKFIKDKLGVTAATIPSNQIRLVGNGGTMLSENNAVPRWDDLQDNAIQVVDGGDGIFNNGDYLLFYAAGSTAWKYDPISKTFIHQKNLYEDSCYYFISFNAGASPSITTSSNQLTANTTVTSFNDYQVHEEDLTNIGKFGKEWWGEAFGNDAGFNASQSFSFDLGQISDSSTLRVLLGSRSSQSGCSFTTSLNGQQLNKYFFPPVNTLSEEGIHISTQLLTQKLPVTPGTSSLTLQYAAVGIGRGYLNYIEWNTRRQLTAYNGNFSFRDVASVGSGKVAEYQIQNANSNTEVWDVTHPLLPIKMKGNLVGTVYTYSQDASTLHEFVAFDGSQFYTPSFTEKISNQNLHGQGQQDYLIVTHPNFLNAANALADFHRNNNHLNVLVATTQQVYNEFSSGSQDISAIRDFAKYFYDNAADSSQMPKYLLLFGDASYDYKNRLAKNTNYVPTFETAESNYGLDGYCSDDFFAFLDDNENAEDATIANTMDIAVGRLPVSSADEAMKIVDKIKGYNSPASLGPWRLSTTIMSDNEDGNIHFDDGEIMANTIANNSNQYNETKVYLSALQTVSTPSGTRAPNANKMINDQVFKGTFLINYNGHGSIVTLSSERILTQDDFNSWKNIDKLPIMVTATCEFSRYDDPEAQSAGEKLILKTDGGAIALLTTTQLVFQYQNRAMNVQYLNAQFQPINGNWPSFGDAFKKSKNITFAAPGTWDNFRKFALLGDPALVPVFPKYQTTLDSLLDGYTLEKTDSMKALGYYQLKGHVNDKNGQLQSNFNGNVYVSIYDKARTQNTITGPNRAFQVQNNIIFKGKASVTNGYFTINFVTPKDLNYAYGKGKISLYVENGQTDGAGTDTNIVVGGFSSRAVVDNNPPIVKPFIGDSLFNDGGITGSNTALFVQLYDQETGINVSGNSIGHDLTAILDDDVANPFVLNDYYETAPNDFRSGYAYFPISGLTDGKHSLKVKAWDMNNNSGEGVIHFEVVQGKIMKVQNLMNYPNPFTNTTTFVFDHNHPNETLEATIQIYNSVGALVRTLKKTISPIGSRSGEITWDGTSDVGAKLPSGLYVYRLSLATSKGIQSAAYEKLVLIR